MLTGSKANFRTAGYGPMYIGGAQAVSLAPSRIRGRRVGKDGVCPPYI